MAKVPPPIIETATRHQVFIEGHKTHIAKTFDPFLVKMAKDIEKRLSGDVTEWNRKRLERQLEHITQDLNDIYKEYYGVWREQVYDFAKYESEFEVRSLENVVENYEFNLPSRTQLNSAVFSNPLSGISGTDGGKLLPAFYKDWSKKTVDIVTGTIRSGYYLGKTTPQIIRGIKGTEGAKFRDGQLARGKRDIELLTRTAVQHAASEARQETYKVNSDLVKGYQWISTIDSRTTYQCISLDGKQFKTGEGPLPPAHIGCRSTTVPVLDERFDFLDEGAERRVRVGKEVKETSAKDTYYSWLKRQPAELQNAYIGPKRASLLRDGGVSAKRFAELGLDKNFQPRTLKEMYELEPLIFERAGINP